MTSRGSGSNPIGEPAAEERHPPLVGAFRHPGGGVNAVKRSIAFMACAALLLLSACTAAAPASTSPSAAPSTAASGAPSASAAASVGPNLQKLLAKGTLNIGTSFDFPPYEYVDSSG